MPDPQQIDALAMAVQSGDREGFRELVLLTEHDLRIFIGVHAGSAELAEEALQHTYVTAFEKLATYRPSGTFCAWLRAIARNHLIDRWRETRRCATLDGALIDELVAAAAEDALDGADDGEDERQVQRLRACIARLPEPTRKLITLRYYDGVELNELARRCKRNAKALSVALFRVRAVLRRCLEEPA